MTVKKLSYLMIALTVTIVSCQKDPSTSDLHKDYLVYTAYDTSVNFSGFNTYYIPDSILLMTDESQDVYWSDEDALEIVNAVVTNMNAYGYTRTEDKETADLGIQMSYVKQVTYFVGYDNPYWWWYYPYYWSPGYWGDWYGWHYPYQVYYGYTAGSMLIEMMNLETGTASQKKLPVIWDSYIGGLLTNSAELNQPRSLQAVDQAFEQSPYLKK